MKRYEIRPIGPTILDGDGAVDTLGAVIIRTEGLEAAKVVAQTIAVNHYWGVAIVDRDEGTVDFGNRTVPLRDVRMF